VSAAIKVLAQAPGRRILVLGALAELGDDTPIFYRELAELARNEGVHCLFATGLATGAADAFGEGGMKFKSNDELIGHLQQKLTANDVVLVKGSRSAAMEKIVDRFTKCEAS